MRENLKDLRDSLHDEHTMHRAKSIAAFRQFDPVEDKAFDKNPHLKALRDAQDGYEAKNNKSLDQFEEKCMKSVQGNPGEVDDHTDWITGKMEENAQVHKKGVTKIAKAMCKAAFGEEEQADEKTLDILKEYLAPHIPAQLLPAVAAKIGVSNRVQSRPPFASNIDPPCAGWNPPGATQRDNQDENAPPLSLRSEGVARPRERQRRRAEKFLPLQWRGAGRAACGNWRKV